MAQGAFHRSLGCNHQILTERLVVNAANFVCVDVAVRTVTLHVDIVIESSTAKDYSCLFEGMNITVDVHLPITLDHKLAWYAVQHLKMCHDLLARHFEKL